MYILKQNKSLTLYVNKTKFLDKLKFYTRQLTALKYLLYLVFNVYCIKL